MNRVARSLPPVYFWIASGCFASLMLVPLVVYLEQTLATHILGLYPLLVAIGFGIGVICHTPLLRYTTVVNRGGFAGIFLITFTLFFWMIPRWMDASLAEWHIALAKYLSLMFLVGLPLAISWQRMHPITKGMFKIEFLSMLFRLGWLYLISPDRLCNNYVLRDQENLGWGLLIVGLSLSITWAIPAFFGPWQSLRWSFRRQNLS